MKKSVELVRMLRTLTLTGPDHAVVLATLSDVATVWRQTGSLAAYEVIVSALDSNDGAVRRWAEETLSRHSPRPASRAS